MSRWWPSRHREPPFDPGLQAERTAMAWQRTALGVGAVGALLLHHAGPRVWAAAPGILGMLVALGLIVASERRYDRMVHRVRSGRPATSRMQVRVLAGITLLLSMAALVLVVLGD